jgi:hypothetical protein
MKTQNEAKPFHKPKIQNQKAKLSPEEIAKRKRFNELVSRYRDLEYLAYPEKEERV